ncbi:hypothetical protein [Rathayibacter tritici]|uniref:hypothetical protein n=1 Tax=Rathayibacter tritici TaxID=33888 RepID=UPI0011B087AE|nr:hypothetical protein [Rathayibacter tritici]
MPDRLPILILFGSLVDTVISLGRTSIQGDRAEGKFRSQPTLSRAAPSLTIWSAATSFTDVLISDAFVFRVEPMRAAPL